MDGSRNTLASPVSIIPSAVPKFSSSGESNENEPNRDQIAFGNFKSVNNSASFISHTISAASKAASPRKKVLAERNGVPHVNQILVAKPYKFSPNTPAPKYATICGTDIKACPSEPSNFEPKASAMCSTNCCNDVRFCPSEPTDDSSLKPYDPITNYLSPRPQFLRYNPNRRHKILLHSENDDAKRGLYFDTKKPTFEEALGEDSQGSSASCFEEGGFLTEDYENSDSRDSSISSFDKGSVEEDERIDNEDAQNYHVGEEDDEMEVIEDEEGTSFKGALKLLFLIVSLISATLYISSMNSPCLSHNLEGVWGSKDQYYKIHHVGVNFSEGTNEPIGLLGKTEVGLMEFDLGGITDGFEEESVNQGLVEIIDEFGEVEAASHSQVEDMCEGEAGSKEESSNQLQVLVTTKVEEAHDEIFKSIVKSSDQLGVLDFTKNEGFGTHGKEKAEEGYDEFQGSETAEISESQKNCGLDSDEFQGCETAEISETEKAEEGYDEFQGSETAEISESQNNSGLDSDEFQGSETAEISETEKAEGVRTHGTEKAEEGYDEFQGSETAEISESQNNSGLDSDEFQGSETGEISEIGSNSGLGSDGGKMGSEDGIDSTDEVYHMVEGDVERGEDIGNNAVDAGNVESGTQSPESVSMESLLKKGNLDSIPATATVAGIFFTILASLSVIYYLPQKKVPVEESPSMAEPLVEPVLGKKVNPRPSTVEAGESDGAEYLSSTSSMIPSVQEEVSKGISYGHSQGHAPSVELLGEFVIGEVSSSLRSCAMKSRNLENEESHDSVSQTNRGGSLVEEAPTQVSSHAKTANLDLSSAASTRLDDQTSSSEKKFVNKKRGKNAEETPVRRSSRVLPSPVRRSSRLRDRSAMSP